VSLSDLLLQCTALINLPALKQHGYSGVSFAMKNHYGNINNPGSFHTYDIIKHSIPELNALPPIKDKTRLIIGDALEVVLGVNWDNRLPGDSLLMSFDPVAHDTVGLKLMADTMKTNKQNPDFFVQTANTWLANAVDLGLGTNDMSQIELKEVTLS
jgi:hypothetical protein